MPVIVPGAGRLPNDILICGEAPGREEAAKGEPFVGRSGIDQQWYLSKHSLNVRNFYRTNVSKVYQDGNTDPTPADIVEWTPVLLNEIAECRPRLIIAVGRFAARWFLGEDMDLDMVHGLPHRAGAFDPTRIDRAPAGCIIVPVTHPASVFHGSDDKKNDIRALVNWDYTQAANALKCIKSGLRPDIPTDEYPNPTYEDLSGHQLAAYLYESKSETIAIDTEGYPGDEWSIQVSIAAGTGAMLRTSRDDFQYGIKELQRWVDRGSLIITHDASTPQGCCYDTIMCRGMGLDLSRANIFNTMYAAYLSRFDPQGLKPLAYRRAGMRMTDYMELIGDIGKTKQLDYLSRVLDHSWPKPEPRVIHEHDGTIRIYTPQPVDKAVIRTLSDIANGKVDKNNNPPDPLKRWHQLDKELIQPVTSMLGPMPIGTLGDIPLADAAHYACMDADATYRVWANQVHDLDRLDLTRTMDEAMEVLPIFEEMQRNGMPASRSHFESLSADMWDRMQTVQQRISTLYYSSQPFNPNSTKQVRSLLRRRGLTGHKKTKSGRVSTDEKSIGYLQFSDPAIHGVFEWREYEHVKDSFSDPVLDRRPPNWRGDIYPVCCIIYPTRTTSQRLSATDPNLLGVPVRTDIGRKVREGYRFNPEDNEVFYAYDLSQIEMRYMAHESADPLMCRLFSEIDPTTGKPRDIHKETAARIFRIPITEVDKFKHRLPAKNAGFGILYGIRGDGLLTQLRMLGIEGWTRESCDKLIDDWLNVYEGVKDYIARVIHETRKTGYSRSRSGMYRYIPGIDHYNSKIAAESGRIAVSQRIQGGAQRMIQRAMAHLKPIIYEMRDSGLNIKWRLQVHDELILSGPPSLHEVIDYIVRDALVNHSGIDLRVPIECEGAMALNWGELK